MCRLPSRNPPRFDTTTVLYCKFQRGGFDNFSVLPSSRGGLLACCCFVVALCTTTKQVVVDACQLRLEAEDIADYAALGFLTLITGSKFYCAPPFCGAVLFPPAALAELEAGQEHLPAGFEDYFTRHEVRTIRMGCYFSCHMSYTSRVRHVFFVS